jgi:hypothetical protein
MRRHDGALTCSLANSMALPWSSTSCSAGGSPSAVPSHFAIETALDLIQWS